jgi:hypothetical protein
MDMEKHLFDARTAAIKFDPRGDFSVQIPRDAVLSDELCAPQPAENRLRVARPLLVAVLFAILCPVAGVGVFGIFTLWTSSEPVFGAANHETVTSPTQIAGFICPPNFPSNRHKSSNGETRE